MSRPIALSLFALAVFLVADNWPLPEHGEPMYWRVVSK